MLTDTIVGLSTHLSPQAVSIVRLSGDQAVSITEQLIQKSLQDSDHKIVYASIYDPLEKTLLDEVLVLVMCGPKSYTREDVVEIQCHGGIYVTQRLLSLVISLGARMAYAGEFTQRAVMNGRLDLSQAQAVNDLVFADSKQSAQLALSTLKGSLKTLINPFLEELLALIAQLEVNIDYPEYDIEQITQTKLLTQTEALVARLKIMVEESKSGQRMSQGVKTAIIGQPNVGKSSLLNALLQEDKAIVTDIPGTTRDIVEGTLRLDNVTLHLLDTAGIRPSTDVVEQIGIRKTFESIEEADLILFLVDGQKGMDASDEELYHRLDPNKVVLVYTKRDLNSQSNRLEISAKHNDIEALLKTVHDRFESDQFVFSRPVLSQTRSIGLASQAYLSLESALKALNEGLEVDLALIDLKECYSRLNAIVGAEDFNLSDELFRRFCLGK